MLAAMGGSSRFSGDVNEAPTQASSQGFSRARVLIVGLVAALSLAGAMIGSAIGDHSGDRHENMALVANFNDGGTYRVGTDMAFWGNQLIAGNLDQGVGPNASPPGGFRVLDISKPTRPAEVGQYVCSGDQSDVSVWGDIVVTSIDKPTQEFCTAEETASRGGDSTWEGLRVVSIADPSNPKLLDTVATRCGSHTNTIYPDRANDRLLVYVLSYPLAGRYNPASENVPLAAGGPGCNAADHGIASVVEVPLERPGKTRVLDTFSVRPSVGCHDVTVFMDRAVAAAACLTESQIWDLSNPARPRIVSHIPNPTGMDLSHSTVFSNDGRTLVIGAELGGAAASPGCFTGSQDDPIGGLFFFDVTDPAAPRQTGVFKLPQQIASAFCTAHLFNVVPRRDGRDTLVSSWYTGATSVIDFTQVRAGQRPRQIAYYIPEGAAPPPAADEDTVGEAAAWASYWYNGHVFSNNFDEDVNSVVPRSRGIDVFRIKHPDVEGALRLSRLNPQLQERLPGARR
jgi:hypothetical protein